MKRVIISLLIAFVLLSGLYVSNCHGMCLDLKGYEEIGQVDSSYDGSNTSIIISVADIMSQHDIEREIIFTIHDHNLKMQTPHFPYRCSMTIKYATLPFLIGDLEFLYSLNTHKNLKNTNAIYRGGDNLLVTIRPKEKVVFTHEYCEISVTFPIGSMKDIIDLLKKSKSKLDGLKGE